METPSPNGSNGRRDAGGRFAAGNYGGPGNRHARPTAAIRALLLDTVTDEDLRAIITKLVEMAKGGDLANLAHSELVETPLQERRPTRRNCKKLGTSSNSQYDMKSTSTESEEGRRKP
jgi:hypothetical protein